MEIHKLCRYIGHHVIELGITTGSIGLYITFEAVIYNFIHVLKQNTFYLFLMYILAYKRTRV